MEGSISYEPKFGRVLIKREIKTTTKGGIIIPEDTAKRHATCEGVIVALGETAGWAEIIKDGERVNILTLEVGQRVLFGRHAGMWLDATSTKDGQNDDGSLFMCQDADILAVIKEQK